MRTTFFFGLAIVFGWGLFTSAPAADTENATSIDTAVVSVSPVEATPAPASTTLAPTPVSPTEATPPEPTPTEPTPTEPTPTEPTPTEPTSPEPTSPEESAADEPWDYSPYRVLVWIVSDESTIDTEFLTKPLQDYLDRPFAAVWRMTFESAPASVASVARRSLANLDFETISAADSVIAVKRNHPDAARIRFASDLPNYVKKILSTSSRSAELKQRVAPGGEATMQALSPLLSDIDGDALELQRRWADESTEAILMSRGMALTLSNPEPKIISPPVSGLVADSTGQYDKIFVVNIAAKSRPMRVQVIELDTLMQVFGPVVEGMAINRESLISTIGSLMIKAFAPVVRIEDAGDKNAVGMIRAGGLIVDEDSPARIRIGDVLIPMVRKDDRNGKPITIGPIPWAFLLVVENEISSFGARSVPEIQVGDKIVRVNGSPVGDLHVLEETLRDSALDTIPIELQRGGKAVEVSLDRSKFSSLYPQYFGFVAADKGSGDNQQLIVTKVLSDSLADGKLQMGDVILSVGGVKGLDVASLRQLVVSSKPEQAIEFTVKRGDATNTVSLVPSVISDTERRQSFIVDMDFHAGRAGGLQGRNNKRTFRMALKSRPYFDNTLIRMHVRGAVNEPLIGYEIYEKALDSKEMTFIGRTDWNGRLWLDKSENPLRLLYVKNGGAVLARLPIVPGQTELEIADMTGDDMRLQAEAYIRGVQNAIVDLIAIRELLAARIRLRLTKGEMKEAEELLESLRNEPTNEKIADDMGKKQTLYLKILGSGNANQRKMIDQMFTTTRELLSKHINPKLIRDLEDDFIASKKNGGRLPEPPPVDDGTTVAKPTPAAAKPAAKKKAATEAAEPAPTS